MSGGGIRHQPISQGFTPQWGPVRIGAGGQITAIYSYTDGTILSRSDNFGGWVYSPQAAVSYGSASYGGPVWRNVITANSIPNWSIDLTFTEGCTEIRAAPSNTNVLYMIWNHFLWVSTTKGMNWVKCTNFPGMAVSSNGGDAMGPYLDIDPGNPDIALIDTGGSGVYKTTNGRSGASATFSQLTTPGTTTTHVISYDPSTTQRSMIYRIGTAGAYESTDNSTWTLRNSGTPPPSTLVSPRMFADKFGQFWVWDAKGNSNIWRYSSATWSQIATGTSQLVAALTCDPNSSAQGSNKVVVSNYSGQINISSNNGSTWSGDGAIGSVAAGASQPTWIQNANQTAGGPVNLNGYSLAFDNSSNLMFGGGLGVWQQNATITATSPTWNINALGIEQLVGTQMRVPPGGFPVFGFWDKGFFTIKNPDVFPSSQWDNDTGKNPILGGWAVDYATSDTTILVGWCTSNISASTAAATSTNGGVTWTEWTGLPVQTGAQGGNIAGVDSTHFVCAPAGHAIQVTSDGGATWTNSTISGTPTNWGSNNSNSLASDRVTSGTIYAVTSDQTFYKSTNSGSSFTATGATSANVDGSANNFNLKAVPGQSGHVFYTSGEQPGSAGSHPAGTHLWKSTDGCASFASTDSNLNEVVCFGFGAAAPSASYPTIYVVGWLNSVYGYYKSINGGTTFSAINVPSSESAWPVGQADFPAWIEGDMDVYGRIYVLFPQSGAAYIDTADARPSVKFTNVNPKDTLTGTTTITAQRSGLVPVSSVQFSVDGLNIGPPVTTPPYSVSFNTTIVPTGSHTLKVTATNNLNGSATQSIPITTA